MDLVHNKAQAALDWKCGYSLSDFWSLQRKKKMPCLAQMELHFVGGSTSTPQPVLAAATTPTSVPSATNATGAIVSKPQGDGATLVCRQPHQMVAGHEQEAQRQYPEQQQLMQQQQLQQQHSQPQRSETPHAPVTPEAVADPAAAAPLLSSGDAPGGATLLRASAAAPADATTVGAKDNGAQTAAVPAAGSFAAAGGNAFVFASESHEGAGDSATPFPLAAVSTSTTAAAVVEPAAAAPTEALEPAASQPAAETAIQKPSLLQGAAGENQATDGTTTAVGVASPAAGPAPGVTSVAPSAVVAAPDPGAGSAGNTPPVAVVAPAIAASETAITADLKGGAEPVAAAPEAVGAPDGPALVGASQADASAAPSVVASSVPPRAAAAAPLGVCAAVPGTPAAKVLLTGGEVDADLWGCGDGAEGLSAGASPACLANPQKWRALLNAAIAQALTEAIQDQRFCAFVELPSPAVYKDYYEVRRSFSPIYYIYIYIMKLAFLSG